MRQHEEIKTDNWLFPFSVAVFSYAIATFTLFSVGF
jgi:hypothetical protein